MSHSLLVGVDPHRKTNTVCMMDRDGQEVCDRFAVQNNRPGTVAFVREVAQRVVEGDFDAIHIATEATGWYWWHFFQTLDRDPVLNCWPVSLYPFNPRLTARVWPPRYSSRQRRRAHGTPLSRSACAAACSRTVSWPNLQ